MSKLQSINIYSDEFAWYIKENIDMMGMIHATLLKKDETVIIRTSPHNNIYLDTCVFHNHYKDGKSRFYIDLEKKYYTCYGCNQAGNIITLVSEIYGISRDQTIEVLAVLLQIFNEKILNEHQVRILNEIKLEYVKKDEDYLKMCSEKLNYFKMRIYSLIKFYIDNNKKIDESRIANRLSISISIVNLAINELIKNDECEIAPKKYIEEMNFRNFLNGEGYQRVKKNNIDYEYENYDDLPF